MLTPAGRALIADFAGPSRMLSWALVGGGVRVADGVVWLQVRNEELGPEDDPEAIAVARLDALGRPGAVGLMTSSDVERFEVAEAEEQGVHAMAVVTAGLSNAVRVGNRPAAARLGTINLLCAVSVPLSDAAALEAMSIAAEARTVAVLEATRPCTQGQGIASGTGTDCIVIASPLGGAGHRFAGKHTALGSVVGASVLAATQAAVRAWAAHVQRTGTFGRVTPRSS